MKAAVRGAIDDVLFGQDVRGALVEINSPAAIFDAGRVVEEVVADDRALLLAQRVDAAHVVQEGFVAVGLEPDVVHVVVLDDVAPRRRLHVAPRPADGDSAVPETVNVVVGDEVAGRLADPQGDATGEETAAVGDRAVGELVAAGSVVVGVANRTLADLHPAGAQVGEGAAREAVLLAAAGKLDAVRADVRELAGVQCRTARPGPKPNRSRRWPPGENRWPGRIWRSTTRCAKSRCRERSRAR